MLYAIPYFSPVIFEFGGQNVESWRIFWFLARIMALLVVLHETRRKELDLKTSLLIFVAGLFLVSFWEKILFYFSHLYLHHDNMYSSLNQWSSFGRVYFGTIVGTFLSVLLGIAITKRWQHVFKYFDVFFLIHLVALFFYRIGNFFMHSHIGKITDLPWGINYFGTVRHEVALYELVSLSILFLVVWNLRKKISLPGFLSLIIIGWISLSRIITDFFRSTDLPNSNFHFQSGLTLNQVIFAVLFIVDISIVIFLFLKKKENIWVNSNPEG